MPSASPTPAEIIALATGMGYKERRPEVSYTLFFEEVHPKNGTPVLLNIFYTTQSIMSFLKHPTFGTNQMWRSHAYKGLEELQEYLINPRKHSGKGYRNKSKAVRGCASCGTFKKRSEFSSNQWRKGPDLCKCKACIPTAIVNHDNDHGISNGPEDDILDDDLSLDMDNLHLQDYEFPSLTLTSDILDMHNKKTDCAEDKKLCGATTGAGVGTISILRGRLERRQFNCPECPKHGRGKHVFFKKVPVFKPVCKCPKCKLVTRGHCARLYPVPKHSEKGYGLFKCLQCKDTWGSSRAIAMIGQQCFGCKTLGTTTMVQPFRLEVVKTTKNRGILGGGPRRGGTRRVPTEPIHETFPTESSYTHADHDRNENAASHALASNSGGEGRSFHFVPRETITQDESQGVGVGETDTEANTRSIVPLPLGYEHSCEGCKTGVCRSRYLPKSLVHDTSDGDTVSTSASITTNSSIDKAEFVDRDQDFDGFEENPEWTLVSPRKSFRSSRVPYGLRVGGVRRHG